MRLTVGVQASRAFAVALAATTFHGTGVRAQRTVPPRNWAAVERALGRPGATQPGGVVKFGFPRGDLAVSVGDVPIKPALALGSWVAFAPTSDGRAVAMGDLVLLESELTPVLDRLQRGGIEQTAIHQHLLDERPRVLYMHIHGRGDPVALATTIHSALAATGTPLGGSAASATGALMLDTAAISRAIGIDGKPAGGVYQLAISRREQITEEGVPLTPAMGVATSINFQPIGEGRAVVTGDFVLTGAEVNPVIQRLRAGGITVTALHSHMLDESPRLFFMHYWGNGDAATLARVLRGALDRTNSVLR